MYSYLGTEWCVKCTSNLITNMHRIDACRYVDVMKQVGGGNPIVSAAICCFALIGNINYC